MTWPKTIFDGEEYYDFQGQILIPVDPPTGAAILLLRPQGGIGVGIPAIAQGDDGAPALFEEGAISFTELAHDDPTPASFSIVEVSPGLYTFTGALHRGEPGDDGTTSLDLGSIGGDAAAGKLIKVNSGVDGFDFAFEKVASVHWPTAVNNTASGNPNSTVAVVSIGAKNIDYRVRARGYQIVRQSGGADVLVNLVARLNGEIAGNIVAKCQGIGGTERLTLVDAPAAGSADTFDKVLAGNAATIHFRTEQQGGSNSYTTSNSEALFVVEALPI